MHSFFNDYLNCLAQLHQDILSAVEDLPQEVLDWQPSPEMNSINVLVTHLCGAQKYLIGDLIKGETTNRDRPAEFESHGLTASDIKTMLKDTLDYTRAILVSVRLDDLEKERHSPIHKRTFSSGWALLHALEHTATHLGHIQLTRQMWEMQA